MNWISVKDRLPEVGESVIVTDGNSDWYQISWRYDKNQSNRDKARKHKDKYPVLLVWNTGCCCNEFFEDEIKYWAKIEPCKDTK